MLIEFPLGNTLGFWLGIPGTSHSCNLWQPAGGLSELSDLKQVSLCSGGDASWWNRYMQRDVAADALGFEEVKGCYLGNTVTLATQLCISKVTYKLADA